CALGAIPFIYLGLSIGSSMNLIANWQPLIDQFCGKLSSWKANLLSVCGRLTLIKAVERIADVIWSWKWIRQRLGGRNEEALWSMVAEIGNLSLSNQPDATRTI
ncbi:hypothetical protein Tco_1480149, partial [Tanacetum coccineum]